MTPKQYLKNRTSKEVEAVAKAAGTTLVNFKHIALWGGGCSPKLARSLSEASGGAMSLEEILFRDEYDRDEETAA